MSRRAAACCTGLLDGTDPHKKWTKQRGPVHRQDQAEAEASTAASRLHIATNLFILCLDLLLLDHASASDVQSDPEGEGIHSSLLDV